MKRFIADLHIHTCLSPCAELDMTPLRIVRRAAESGLDIIAISDHNSAENAGAALRAASGAGITVLPALEITSREEVHVLALFGSEEGALKMQEKVYGSLLEGEVFERDWQVVVNEKDEVMGFNRRLLIGATGFALGDLVEEVRLAGGLAMACHVDRGAFSVSSQLGFMPEGLGFDAAEVIEHGAADRALVFHPGIPRIMSSDAHNLRDIGLRTTVFEMEDASFSEIGLALRGMGGRSVACRGG
jgi:PHP family Zn ribbon phosphoesterase